MGLRACLEGLEGARPLKKSKNDNKDGAVPINLIYKEGTPPKPYRIGGHPAPAGRALPGLLMRSGCLKSKAAGRDGVDVDFNILTAFIRLGRAGPEGAGCPPKSQALGRVPFLLLFFFDFNVYFKLNDYTDAVIFSCITSFRICSGILFVAVARIIM